MQYLGFGNGSDGDVTLSGTDAPIDSSCSGSASSNSLSATNVSFAEDKIILIHQSRGTGVGAWELNIIDSYTAGTITTVFALANTYTDSGASQAQVIQLKEYSSVTVSGTYTAKTWNGDVGGILAFLCNGKTAVSGTITADSTGYDGGTGGNNSGAFNGYTGEGTVGAVAATSDSSANGSGGGQGRANDTHAGGGGNAGTGGGAGGGASSGNASLSSMTFGGGGGGLSRDNQSSAGSRGGGIIAIWTNELEVTGAISSGSATTSLATTGGSPTGSGGTGAGGSIYIVAQTATLGTSLVTALAANSGGGTRDGGKGSNGRIAVQACDIAGTTNPSANESEGGNDWCQSFIHIADT